VDPHIRHIACPGLQVRLERGEALELPTGDRVLLHVADATRILALRPGPAGRAGLDLEAPVPREGMKLGVHHHLARDRVMVLDQRPGVVERHLFRHAPEGPEAAFHAVEPVLLAFAPGGPGVQPAGIAPRRDEEEHLLHPVPDLDAPLAEVDLQLLTRPRLEPHRRAGLGALLPAQVGDRALDRAQAHRDPELRRQFLPDHIGIAGMAEEPLAEPSPLDLRRAPAALRQPSLHRVPRTPRFGRDPLAPPTAGLQRKHGRHLIRRPHLDPPRHPRR